MSLDRNSNIYISEFNSHRVVKWLAPNYKTYLIVAGNRTASSEVNRLFYPRTNSTIGEIVMQDGDICPCGIECDCYGNIYVSQDKTIQLIN
ncbi:unnamed protein product [Adineta ricciae]|uniref:Uncharacterized protein n=1 Tax=Adineta ricciae TaxID=249248 RepID=A0A815D9U0_ADIRI|nr:unnamed protein product [Adineta ricciae]